MREFRKFPHFRLDCGWQRCEGSGRCEIVQSNSNVHVHHCLTNEYLYVKKAKNREHETYSYRPFNDLKQHYDIFQANISNSKYVAFDK